MSGWVKTHRSLISHEMWLDEPFTRGQAWIDLILLAQFKPGHIRVRGIRIDLERGQVGWSELRLSERWRWSRGKVRRFLDELKKEDMADYKTDNKTLIVTILNYSLYQKIDNEDGQQNEQQTDTKRTPNGHQTDTNKKDKNGKNGKNKISFVENSIEFRLALYLFNCIRLNKPDFKKPNFQAWSKHVDYMIRIDKRDPDKIKEVIKWVQSDNTPDGNGFCWAHNVLSTDKLRKQFDQLCFRMKSKNRECIMGDLPPELR